VVDERSNDSTLVSRRSATKTRELRNLRRASRGTSSINARTPTRSVSVSHPTLGGLTERVERVVDTLDSMLIKMAGGHVSPSPIQGLRDVLGKDLCRGPRGRTKKECLAAPGETAGNQWPPCGKCKH
jgi:uncharacterized heparinase superfamily protein